MKKTFYYNTTIGRIGIAENGEAITNVFFGNSVVPKEFEECETTLLKEAANQINEYFAGLRMAFALPLQAVGTKFEQSVWDILLTIPYGEVRSYGQIAKQIGNSNASRAVGRANGLNPVSIIIPCHRVIGASGSLTGYAGGVHIKQQLLDLEKQIKHK